MRPKDAPRSRLIWVYTVSRFAQTCLSENIGTLGYILLHVFTKEDLPACPYKISRQLICSSVINFLFINVISSDRFFFHCVNNSYNLSPTYVTDKTDNVVIL